MTQPDRNMIPATVQALHQRALDASAAGRMNEALTACEEAVTADANFALGWANLACLLTQRQDIERAIGCMERARAIAPTWSELQKNFAVAHSAYVMGLQYSERVGRDELVAAHRRWFTVNGAHLPVICPAGTSRASDKGKLRVGFVSPDLYSHPVGMLLYAPLKGVDRERFSLHFFSDTQTPDRLTVEFKAIADSWDDVRALSDEALAQSIRAKGIDILFDLAGHTRANRLRVFCMRPAPLQATWLGYFDTTGIPAIDYALTSHYLAPMHERGAYAETPLYFRHNYFSPVIPHFAPTQIAPTFTADTPVTFGCFNNTRKLNAEVIDTWATVLHHVPTARLVLRWETLDTEQERERLRALFRANGISDGRVEMHGRIPYDKLFECYRDIDVALDPFPYSGGMSSCDSLLMGVPVVTLYADRPAGRQSASFLHQMGLPELVCHSRDEYVQRAVWLAGQRARAVTMRREIALRYRSHLACTASSDAEFASLLTELADRHFPDRS